MPLVTTGTLKGTLTGNSPDGNSFKSFGTVTLNGATPVTITDEAYVSGDFVQFALKTVGGTVGAIPSVKTTTTGAPTVAGTASDTSIYNYIIFTGTAQAT